MDHKTKLLDFGRQTIRFKLWSTRTGCGYVDLEQALHPLPREVPA